MEVRGIKGRRDKRNDRRKNLLKKKNLLTWLHWKYRFYYYFTHTHTHTHTTRCLRNNTKTKFAHGITRARKNAPARCDVAGRLLTDSSERSATLSESEQCAQTAAFCSFRLQQTGRLCVRRRRRALSQRVTPRIPPSLLQ